MTRDFPIPTVGALILHDDKVLLIRTHKWGGRWGIPGGKIHYGEALMDALTREVNEETGLEINNIRFALVQEAVNSSEFYKPAHFILVNYFASTKKDRVILNDEAEEFRWVAPAAALSLDLNSFTKVLIEAYLEWQKK